MFFHLKEEFQLSMVASPKKNRLLDKFSKLSFLHVSWLNEKLTHTHFLSLFLSL